MKPNNYSKPPQVRARIVITLFDDGNFQVNGPLHDRILYYGLLEMARDSVLMQAGREVQQRQAAEAVKGSKPWWRKIFAGKVKVPGAANDARSRVVAVPSDDAKAVAEALRGPVGGAPLGDEERAALRKGELGNVEKFDPHLAKH